MQRTYGLLGGDDRGVVYFIDVRSRNVDLGYPVWSGLINGSAHDASPQDSMSLGHQGGT